MDAAPSSRAGPLAGSSGGALSRPAALVALLAVSADLIVAWRQAGWWLSGLGPSSWLGWYALRGLIAATALAALLSVGGAAPSALGLRGPHPAGALRPILRLSAWVLLAYLGLLGGAVLAIRAGWFVPTAALRDVRHLEDAAAWAPVALVAAPLVEEAVYRALAVPALCALAGRRAALLLSGPLFLLLHVAYGYPPWLLHYVVAGSVLAWAFLRSGRLWVVVALHALGNLLMVADDVLLLLAPDLVRALLGPAGEPLFR